MYNYINNFFNDKEKSIFTYTENDRLTENLYTTFKLTDKWKYISNLYKKLVSFNSLTDFELRVSPYASFFIKSIYEKYVNENTLVITSEYEHPNVVEYQKLAKNIIKLNYQNLCNTDIDYILKLYKDLRCNNILVYVVGTISYNGLYVPQSFYQKLKQTFTKYNIKHIIICDACHELYLNDRNYDIFDYVIYNCKPLLGTFNMGMLWTKNIDINFNCDSINEQRALNFLDKLNIFRSHLKDLKNFQSLIKDYFSDILCSNIELLDNTVEWISTIKTKNLIFIEKDKIFLKEHGINLEDITQKENYISLRLPSYINNDPNILLEGLNYLKNALKRALKRKSMLL